ncbi:MAG: M23 family metallopeptidase [Solirubrobacterales bacterium]
MRPLAVLAAAVALLLALVLGGALVTAPAGAATGGAVAPKAPRLSTIDCRLGCVGVRRAATRATVTITGASLDNVTKIEFSARGRKRKLVRATVGENGVQAKIPSGFHRTRIRARAIDSFGQRSPLSRGSLRVDPLGRLRYPASRAPKVVSTAVKPSRIFYGESNETVLRYVARGTDPLDIEVTVVRESDGATVRSFSHDAVEPNSVQIAAWDGKTADGQSADEGGYLFVARPRGSAQGARNGTLSASEPNVRRVRVLRHAFPVDAPVTYGEGAGRFGAPRGGYGHQGQDIFARCGSRIVAASGGEVTVNQYHSAAGYYVVIDGNDGYDYAYMHLRSRSPLKVGDRISTGDAVGPVGETGRATGCHLHFEIWTAPGWRSGGSPTDPMPFLKDWQG